MNPCCDFKLDTAYPAYAPDFPSRWRSGEIHRAVYAYTRTCAGCMYGSYPEITITARFLKPLLARAVFFNRETHNLLKKVSAEDMFELAREIRVRNERRRAAPRRDGIDDQVTEQRLAADQL